MDASTDWKSPTLPTTTRSRLSVPNLTTTMKDPVLPDVPDGNDIHSNTWLVDMNYLMPFSVMLMILCVLLLILCYLRHRMRQRRLLQRELQLRRLMTTSAGSQHIDGAC